VRPAREISQAEIAEVLSLHVELMDLPRTSLEKAIRIGEKLRGWRNLFPPRSGWQQWCQTNIKQISKDTIVRYIRAADNQGELLRITNNPYSEPLTLTQALNRLSDSNKPGDDPVDAAKPAKRPKQLPAKPEPKPKPKTIEADAQVTTEPAPAQAVQEPVQIEATVVRPRPRTFSESYQQKRSECEFANRVFAVKQEAVTRFEEYLCSWHRRDRNAVMQVIFDYIAAEMKREAAA
jgi:hypothetical protein